MTAAITAWVGLNGHGKTLGMVRRLVPVAEASGRRLLANFEVYEVTGQTQRRHRLWEPLTSWRQLHDVEHAVLMLDEITACVPARQAMSLPAQLARTLNQLRKRDVVCGWTAPAWARADVILREVTQRVVYCRGLWPARSSRTLAGERVVYAAGWRPNRLFYCREYDSYEFEEFTKHVRERIRPRRHEIFRRGDGQWWYRTGASVDLLDHLDDVGVCVACGGSRRRHRCTCVTDSASPPGEAGRVPAEGRGDPGPARHTQPGRHEAPRVPRQPLVKRQTTQR